MNDITQPSNVLEIVAAQDVPFSKMLSDEAIHWEKESQFAIQALQSNDFLNKTAWNNKASLQNAIINIAAIGITLNPASKHAYLVPRDGRVCLDISYMGLMHLAQKTGSILWGQSKLVYQSDEYFNTGIDTPPQHKSNPFLSGQERGSVIGAYCTVKTADGSYLTEEMSIDELNKVRDSSKGYQSAVRNGKQSPWTSWPEEMMRKTVVKRASKYWPKVERLDLAINELNSHEGLAPPEEKEVNPISDNPHDDLKALLHDRGSVVSDFISWASKKLRREITTIDQLTNQEAQSIINKMENAQ